MRLIAASTLANFGAANPTSATALNHWRGLVNVSDWKPIKDVRSSASTAKSLNADRVRCEIAGGGFRLIASINFRRSIVFVKFIGTHAEYDPIDALTVTDF